MHLSTTRQWICRYKNKSAEDRVSCLNIVHCTEYKHLCWWSEICSVSSTYFFIYIIYIYDIYPYSCWNSPVKIWYWLELHRLELCDAQISCVQLKTYYCNYIRYIMFGTQHHTFKPRLPGDVHNVAWINIILNSIYPHTFQHTLDIFGWTSQAQRRRAVVVPCLCHKFGGVQYYPAIFEPWYRRLSI